MILFHTADLFSPKYLLLKHVHGEHWSFPKGTVEAGESDWETAIRELEEETGITAFEKVPDFSVEIHYQFERDGTVIDKSVIYFLGQVADTTTLLSEEHTAFEWLPYDEARIRLTHENARLLLDKVNAYLQHES